MSKKGNRLFFSLSFLSLVSHSLYVLVSLLSLLLGHVRGKELGG